MKIKTLIIGGAIGLTLLACDDINKNINNPVNMDELNGATVSAGKELPIDPNNMDTLVKPGNNFFEYANGGWLKANPIPEEYSRYGAFEILGKKNQKEIKAIIDELSAMSEVKKGSPEQQIRDFYNSGMDTVRIEELGYKPIQERLKEINAMQSTDDLIAMQAKLNFEGSMPVFALFGSPDDKDSKMVIAHLMQYGLGLPDRDYYTKDDERTNEIRAKYLEHLKRMFELIGYDENVAAQKAQSVMKIETRLAEASMTMLERRDPNATYNMYNREDLKKLMGAYDIGTYLTKLGIGTIDKVNVRQPKFFAEVGKMMEEVPMEDWIAYYEWNVTNSNANSLSSAFVDQNFDFYKRTLSGVDKMKPRWKRMISATNGNLGDPVGKMYVERYFPAASKERMLELVGNLKIALGESIQNLDWMSEQTKEKALEKLQAINVKVGYPDKWIDYSSVEITPDNFIQNTWNCNAFSYKRMLNKIGKPVDPTEWGMTPQTVNAYYNPNRNEIVFPAAILQAPFFSADADDAVNYGAIGVVIGHEMTHGFDDQGRLYDKDGNLKDWWTEEDAEKFKEKTQILVKQFDNFVVLDSLHVNGKLTLGENIADNGGLFISHAALLKSFEKNGEQKDIDGLNYDQRFFISYAQVWRQHIRPAELMRRLQEDVHSPGIARVNAGVANLPWWYEAFNVQPGDSLYIAPEHRAKIW
jgi:putative endopeptidase